MFRNIYIIISIDINMAQTHAHTGTHSHILTHAHTYAHTQIYIYRTNTMDLTLKKAKFT